MERNLELFQLMLLIPKESIFTLDLIPKQGKPDLIVNPNLREHIQPSLFQLRDYINNIVHTSQTSMIGLQEQL